MGEWKRSKQQTRDFNNFWKDRKPIIIGGSAGDMSYHLLALAGTGDHRRLVQGMQWKASLKA